MEHVDAKLEKDTISVTHNNVSFRCHVGITVYDTDYVGILFCQHNQQTIPYTYLLLQIIIINYTT